MRFLSLFSGIGGVDLGFERAGMRCVGQVEIDVAAASVLAEHWPDVPRLGDIASVGADELAGLGPIDLIAGGFPCQDVSVAGRRAGLAGERSGLWYEFHRVLALVRPPWVVIENVPGLLSSCGCPNCRPPKEATAEEREDDAAVARWTRPDHRGRDFALLLRGLVELGYGVAWRVLDAQYFGIPQRRRRVFVVGHLGEPWSASASVFFEPESCAGDSPPSRASGAIASALTRNGVGGGGGPDDNSAQGNHLIAASLTSGVSSGPGVNRPGRRQEDDVNCVTLPEIARALVSPASGYRSDGETETFIPVDFQNAALGGDVVGTLDSGVQARSNRGHGVLAFHLTQDPISDEITPAMSAGNSDGCATLGVLTADTLRSHPRPGSASTGAVVAVPTAVRRLTPMECERLQGFPDGWTAGQSDATRYRQLGNAVCVPVAEWIGHRLPAVVQRNAA